MRKASHKNNVFLTDELKPMELRRKRQHLTSATIAVLLVSAAVIHWSLAKINEPESRTTDTSPNVSSTEDTTNTKTVSLSKALTKRQLRAPLYDHEPKPPPAAKPAPPPQQRQKATPKLNLTLVGTIIEAENSLAIIADPNGQFDVKGIGEILEVDPAGIAVANIEAEQVTLDYRGDTTVLVLERKQKKNKPSSGNRNLNRKRSSK